ncbi:hypothetical protein QE152_g17114 [Popillia japonica]|uniref:Uncharacterized protein n=1 Tax=Popillia japonica TaxID=7064 RepID=A0AAW1L1R3_POPJA
MFLLGKLLIIHLFIVIINADDEVSQCESKTDECTDNTKNIYTIAATNATIAVPGENLKCLFVIIRSNKIFNKINSNLTIFSL